MPTKLSRTLKDADGETTRYFAQPATGTFFGKFALSKAADPEALKGEQTRAVVGDLLASLGVKIKKHDGTIIHLSDVPSLKIELENVDVLPPETNTELPEYKDSGQRQAPKVELDETVARL